ncbi:hypothetical protein TNCV_3676711 [Trichonephila clavipes]|nr:hypothetical protein TNCV_3676711 [Trichonephila clavipes]
MRLNWALSCIVKYLKLNSVVQQPIRAKAYCVLGQALVILDAEVHELMLRSGGQSDAKSPMFSSQASLVHIYRPTEGMNGWVDLAQPRATPASVLTLPVWVREGFSLNYPTLFPVFVFAVWRVFPLSTTYRPSVPRSVMKE